MKKAKLTLKSETLRKLEPDSLKAVAGGITGLVCTPVTQSICCPPSELCTINFTCFPTDECTMRVC